LSLKVNDVSKTYQDGNESFSVLKNVTFSLNAGDLIALCGPSGAGKTTLLNMIAGLDYPDSGEIWFQDKRMDKLDERSKAGLRSSSIGIIFQNPNLVTHLNVLENVLLPTFLAAPKQNKSENKAFAIKLLESLGLGGKMRKFPPKLSEGERRRVSVARALISRPKLVLADEPTINLDSDNSTTVMQLLKASAVGSNAVVLISTHDEEIAASSDRSLRIRFGKVESSK
jgi:ABC-type lipoprotein export system ATPase subunit